jgi:hypothetical protein
MIKSIESLVTEHRDIMQKLFILRGCSSDQRLNVTLAMPAMGGTGKFSVSTSTRLAIAMLEEEAERLTSMIGVVKNSAHAEIEKLADEIKIPASPATPDAAPQRRIKRET